MGDGRSMAGSNGVSQIWWLLPAFALTTLAFGGSMVPRLNLVLTLICRAKLADKAVADQGLKILPVILGADNPQCQTPEIQALSTRFNLYTNILAGVLSAITTPKLGMMSDRLGRIRIIAATTACMSVGELVTIVAATWPEHVPINWLFLSYFFEGIGGSFTASMALTHSYAADCSPRSRRNEVFGYFHGALYAGIAAGPLIAGYIVKAAGMVSIFYVSFACHLTFVFFLAFLVPESLSLERRSAAHDDYLARKVNPQPWSISGTLKSANLLAPLSILLPTGPGSSRALRSNLLLLSVVNTVSFGVAIGVLAVVVYYSEFIFGWGNLESSIFVSIVNSLRVVVLVVIIPILTRIFRNRQTSSVALGKGASSLDLWIIRVGFLFDTVGYLGYVLARTGALFTVAGAITAVGSMSSPALQSALTKHVPPDRVGQVLGACGLLNALARVVAPTIFSFIYGMTVGKFTPTVFVVLTATYGLNFLLSLIIKPHGGSCL